MIDFVIINYKTPELTCKCIKTIYDTYGNSRIIVVDNASGDLSAQIIHENYPEVEIIVNSENKGYAAAVNIGVNIAMSDLVLVSNSDVEFYEGSIKKAEELMMSNKRIAVCGFNQLYPDGAFQRSFGLAPGYKLALMDLLLLSSINKIINEKFHKIGRQNEKVVYPDYADGAALLLKRDVFRQLGGFDEDYFFYTEEADYCARIRKVGYLTAVNNRAIIMHIRGAGRKKGSFDERAEKLLISTKLLFIIKHGSIFEAKFFKFSQYTYFLTISVFEIVLSFLTKNDNLKEKSIEHKRLSYLWRKAEIAAKL